MDRSRTTYWRSKRFLPLGEGLEGRQLLSGLFPPYLSHGQLFALLHNLVGNPAVRPNLPVCPMAPQRRLDPRTSTRRFRSTTGMRSS